MLLLLIINIHAVLLPMTTNADQMMDKLESWVTITSVKMEPGANKGSTEMHLTTDDTEIGDIDFVLTQRGNLHSAHLKSSVTKCLYQGHISKDKQTDVHSPVRIKYCDKDGQNIPELSGLVFLNGKVYTLYTNNDEGRWIMFSTEHMRKDLDNEKVCGTTSHISLKKASDSVSLDPKKKRLQLPAKNSRSRRNAQERSYVEVILFHGFDWYQEFGPSEQDLLDKDIEIVHFADFYYAGLTNINLHLSLVDVHTFTSEQSDPTYANGTTNGVLDLFLNYHWENLQNFPNHDNAILLIVRNFTENAGTVGLAYIGVQCDMWGSGSWVKDYDRNNAMTAGTLAHELGHNFGLDHNPTNESDPCFCSEEGLCVMSAYTSDSPPQLFSNCQQASLENFMEHGNSMCLHNEPSKQIEEGYCGDYIVNRMDGEECDCGAVDTCDDRCCHPNNCTLVTGASCSAMDLCCDPDTCQVRNSSFVCRAEGNDCDIAEQCNGTSAECPRDEYKRAGVECTADGADGHCYAGSCRSAYSQCLQIYEPNGLRKDSADTECWGYNRHGDEWGNCGSNFYEVYTPCSRANQKCGKLQCTFNWGVQPIYKRWVSEFTINLTTSITCYSIEVLFHSIDVADDLAYVRNGIWCGKNSFCHNKRCRHVSEIPGLTTCPYNCYGNGNCNSETNECECDEGNENQNCISTSPRNHAPAAASLALVTFLYFSI